MLSRPHLSVMPTICHLFVLFILNKTIDICIAPSSLDLPPEISIYVVKEMKPLIDVGET